MTANLEWDGLWKGPKQVGSATLGTAWQDIGTAFRVGGACTVSAFVELTINDSQNARFRAVGLTQKGGTEYEQLVRAKQNSYVQVESRYFEINNDEDLNFVVDFECNATLPFMKFQAQVGTVGGTGATIKLTYLTSTRG
jgi:hypothetical protein